MKPQVILRKIAAAADHFAKLPQVASRRAQACIQSQAVTLDTLQLKADPVIPRATLGTQNHGLANQIFNHRFDLAIIEEVAYRHSTAHLRNLDGGPSQRTDVLERDRKSTRLNSSHLVISYAVFCLKKKNRHN